jgi:dTDP-4-dehydrorhamnose reductase
MKYKKILVTGANGQLGSELRQIVEKKKISSFFEFVSRADFELSSASSVKSFLEKKLYDCIIHGAAYTAVDKAEKEEELARSINKGATAIFADYAKKNEIPMLYVSTDFIFDGGFSVPIKVDENVNPLSVYGQTKYEGEQEIISSGCESLIVRTSWVYSSFGANFVKTMLKHGESRERLTIISDQIGTPTYAKDLANFLILNLERSEFKNGIYNYSNEGAASWFDFAHSIMEYSGTNCEVLPIFTKDYPTPARRPSYSLLNKEQTCLDFEIKIPHWRESLKKCLAELGQLK